MATATQTKTDTRPKRPEDVPQFKEAAEKLGELNGQLADVSARLEAMRRTIASPSRADVQRAAEALLNGEPIAVAVATEAECRELERQRAILEAAAKLQGERLNAARLAAYRTIREAHAEEHRELVAAFADALAAAGERLEQLLELENVTPFGDPWEAVPHRVRTVFRDESDRKVLGKQSPAGQFIAEAAKYSGK